MTTQEQLNQINAAIAAIEAGEQSYSVDGLSVRRPDLSTLYKERRTLQQLLNEEDSGSVCVAQFDGR